MCRAEEQLGSPMDVHQPSQSSCCKRHHAQKRRRLITVRGERGRFPRNNRYRQSVRMVVNISTTHLCQIIGYSQTVNDTDDEKGRNVWHRQSSDRLSPCPTTSAISPSTGRFQCKGERYICLCNEVKLNTFIILFKTIIFLFIKLN